MWGVSRLVEKRLASQEGLCAMERKEERVLGGKTEGNTV